MNDQTQTEADPTAALLEARTLVERRRRMRVVSIVIPGLLGALIGIWSWGLSDDYFRFALGLRKELVLLSSVSLLGLSGLAAVMTYLQTGFTRNDARELELELLRRSQYTLRQQKVLAEGATLETLRLEVASLREQMAQSNSTSALLGEKDHRDLVNELQARLNEEVAGSIVEAIHSDISATLARESKERASVDHLQESRARLLKELEALGRRGNLNLALGAVTTVVGISLLGMSVFSEVTTAKDTWSFMSHFLPRVTLVVLIELFAYFFLSLYKTSLNEIKYFQNELTNIEAKQVALRAALQNNAADAVAGILNALASTERNHVLTKDQTTVELEKAKIEKDGRNEFAKYVAEFFQKKA